LSKTNSEISVYIHWPYCIKKCPYCDFNSHVSSLPIDNSAWKDAYKNEIDMEFDILGKRTIKSIFFGGGTPSLMPPNLVEAILKQLENKWSFSNNIEITVEANPSSVEIKNFINLEKAGINRISLGLQSLNNNSLEFLGRTHSAEDGFKALEIAKQNFKKVSFDLIYGLPDQNEKIWEHELKEAINISGEHMSAYQLTIEKGTPFYASYRDNKFDLPSENTLLNLYNITDELLSSAKFKKYEVSNYALKKSVCIHNLSIWQGLEYCGIGPGSHGRVLINNKWYATHKFSSPKLWLKKSLEKKITLYKNTKISEIERAQEILLTGLRLNKGINTRILFKKLNINNKDQIIDIKALQRLEKLNLIETNNSLIKVTKKGFPILNHITSKLIR
jgi:oxygen-independent coproporphyrinogen-3 oxidase